MNKQITKQDDIAEHKPRPDTNAYVFAGGLSVLGLAISGYLLYNKFKKQERNLIDVLPLPVPKTSTEPNRKNDLILTMTPEKQDKTLELSKHWSADSTPARNEVIMKRTYPVKLVKCNKICSNY